MSLMVDVTADQSPLPGRLAVQDVAAEEVAALAEELVVYHQHFAPLFYRREQREWAELYLRGLLTADVPRKNVEAIALRLLGVGPHADRQVRALQQFIGEGKWDDEALLAEHQRLVNKTLGEADGVLIIDGSDFPKHGDHSAGVAPQWCGHSGKKDNCQAGVFLGYASRKAATVLDRRLSLPESWFAEDHRTLWQDCPIPDEIAFQTKHELAAQLVENLVASEQLQARWVVCDEGYGDAPAFLQRLDATGLGDLAEVPRDTKVWPWLEMDGQTSRARPSSWVHPIGVNLRRTYLEQPNRETRRSPTCYRRKCSPSYSTRRDSCLTEIILPTGASLRHPKTSRSGKPWSRAAYRLIWRSKPASTKPLCGCAPCQPPRPC